MRSQENSNAFKPVEVDNFFIDIDGTITDYTPEEQQSGRRLFGNFLFPIISDLMVERGFDRARAEELIRRETDENTYWDYPDFLHKFELPQTEALNRFRQWHSRYLSVYDDLLTLIATLARRNKRLFIISNNPASGCRLKLERAGLHSDSGHAFNRIISTDLMKGCKHSSEVWQRALALAGVDPARTATIGDNPHEDGEVPQSCGVANSFILDRRSADAIRVNGRSIIVNHALNIKDLVL